MKIGTYYYPEQWPREQWQRDFDRMAAMGMQIVHMAEFAWYSLEPRPGEFRFDWLDECMDLARSHNLDVILCTPTAAPPIWLGHEQPSTLPVDVNGIPYRYGGRRHYSPTSSAFREATTRIVTAMAERYGGHSSVIGWQIDNEYGLNFDQSAETHAAFRAWLQRRYSSIDALNEAWGNQFWNQYYTSFEQILLPKSREPGYNNPHQTLDASRFWSWVFADFNKLQADILKPRIGDRFITTNFMPFHLDCDPGEMRESLSLYSWDAYPVSGWEKDIRDETYRIADPTNLGFLHDQMASYTGRWAQMELQPGQVNWSGVPVLLYPGAVRLWVWTAYAHGAEFVTTYRFRQPRWGIELFHAGLIGTDGVTPTPGGRQFQQCVDEMKRLDRAKRAPAAPVLEQAPVAKTEERRFARRGSSSASQAQASASALAQNSAPPQPVGLLFDFDQLYYFASLPQARKWSQGDWLKRWYTAIVRLGLPVKILHPNRDWPEDVKLIIAPSVQMVDDALVQRWDSYASNGGHLVLTCRTGLMDRNGQLWEGPTAAPILSLIGATIEAYDGLPDDLHGTLEMDGKQHKWNVWGDLLYAEPATRTLAKYADQFYAGAIAATQRRHGQGIVTYCGAYGGSAFIDALVEKVATQTGHVYRALPPRVHVLSRDGYRILLNYNERSVEAPAPASARFMVGARKVEPAGVAVWEE